MGGPYRDRGGYRGGALENERALSPSQEGGNPVDHVEGYVFGKEKGPKLRHIHVVKSGLYVEEEVGEPPEWSLEGSDFMHEGDYCVRGAKAREGAALVRVEQANLPCQGGEPDRNDAFKDLRNRFEEDDYSERGRGVLGWLAGFVPNDPVRVFESGGMVAKGN